MKITDVEAIYLKIGDIVEECNGTQDALIVKITTDAGIVGWGEVDSSPPVIKAIFETPMSHTLSYGLRELLIGEDPFEVDRLWEKMYRGTIYYGRRGAALQAISGADIALWDIIGKACNKPIYKMMGGGYRTKIRAYASMLMPNTPAEAAAKAEKWASKGFTGLKLGWGPIGQDAANDVALVAAARKAVGPDVNIMIDAGHVWDAATAIQRARKFEEQNIYWLEEPLPPDDLDGYAQLADAVDVRISAGEEDATVAAFEELLVRGRIDLIQPDVSRAGGLTECKKIADLAHRHNKPCVPHAFSTGILLSSSLHLIASIPNGSWLEYTVESSPLVDDLMVDKIPAVDGWVNVPEGPGLGIEVNEAVLDKYRVG